MFKLSHNAKDAGIQLSVTISRDIPERVLIDANKFIWVGKSLIQSAIHAVPRGMFFGRGGGMVRVALTYHADLLSITVEDDGGERTEECLEEPSFHGPSGRMNGAGKFARDIVESHGGMMVWEKATFGAEQKRGTRVSITVPARSALPLGALKFDY
ncbi:MAG: ATP-binding protein [Bdellovibrionota bacterium]